MKALKAAIRDSLSPATLLSVTRRARNLLAQCDDETRDELSKRIERREFDILLRDSHEDCHFLVTTLRELGVTDVASAQQLLDTVGGGGVFRETLQDMYLAVDFDASLMELEGV